MSFINNQYITYIIVRLLITHPSEASHTTAKEELYTCVQSSLQHFYYPVGKLLGEHSRLLPFV